MKLGLGSYTFRWSIGFKDLIPANPLLPVDLLSIAAAHGLEVVQYADNIPLGHLDNDQLDTLKSKADDLNIKIELGTQSFDAKEVRQYLQIAKRLDANLLRVALDLSDARKPVSELATEFKKLLPEVKAAGVRLAVENHFNFPSPQLLELLSAIKSDHVGVCLDVANSICAGEWPMETVRMLAPHAINLHLKDFVIVPDPYGVGFKIQGCPLGQGRADAKKIMAALPQDDNMSVILEHWLPSEHDMDSTRQNEHVWLSKHVRYARKKLAIKQD